MIQFDQIESSKLIWAKLKENNGMIYVRINFR